MKLTRKEYAAMLRADFYAFAERCFHHLNPTDQFAANWHLEVIAAKLQACMRGEVRRLIICVPPRSLKSTLASVALPAFWMGLQPSARILCVSYAQDLAEKLSSDTRSVMQADWFKDTFATRLAHNKQAVGEFATTRQGFRMATSIGGVLTGRGADVIILDDPLKPEEALSDVTRNKVNDWFSHTLYSRLNDKENCCIILVMQRLHEDDLVGHVLDQEPWEVVSFPAIAHADEEYEVATLYGPRRFFRKAGEALQPERESLEVLEKIRHNIGSYNFAGQYLQAPAPLGGGMVRREWFKTYNAHTRPERFSQIIQSWDTANKANELANYSACTTWGISDNNIYLLNAYRKQLDYPNLKRAVRELGFQFGATVILIEDKASGTQLLQELKAEGLYRATAFKPEGDKVMRLHAQTATIENGFVFIPEDEPWLDAYLHEMMTFPKGRNSDQVDSTSQALEWIKVGQWRGCMGLYEYFRQQYGQMHGHHKRIVRVKAPEGKGKLAARGIED